MANESLYFRVAMCRFSNSIPLPQMSLLTYFRGSARYYSATEKRFAVDSEQLSILAICEIFINLLAVPRILCAAMDFSFRGQIPRSLHYTIILVLDGVYFGSSVMRGETHTN